MRNRATVENPGYQKKLVQTVGAKMLDELQLPLATIAQVVGASPMSVSRWVRGKLTPLPAAQNLLEKAYGIEPDLWHRNAYTIDELYALQAQLPEPAAVAAPTAPADTDEGVANEPDTLSMAQALEADLAFAAELELQGKHDIAAKLLANCLIDYADIADDAPEPTTVAPEPLSLAKPAKDLDGPKPATEGPLRDFPRRGIHREVAQYGLEVATARLRGRGVQQWQIDEAMSLPAPAPRE